MATRPYNSPLLSELQALGVMFASPPAGAVNMAGVAFDGAGDPTQLQNPAGALKDFPGGGAGGIPIPANNSGLDVEIQSGAGGDINISTQPDVNDFVGQIKIQPAAAPNAEDGASVLVAGGNSDGGSPGPAQLLGGNDGSGATGAKVECGGSMDGSGGNLQLRVGHHGSGVGALVIGSVLGSLAEPADTSTVTVAALGPADGNVAISKWIPVTLDGVNGFLPFFTVVP